MKARFTTATLAALTAVAMSCSTAMTVLADAFVFDLADSNLVLLAK